MVALHLIPALVPCSSLSKLWREGASQLVWGTACQHRTTPLFMLLHSICTTQPCGVGARTVSTYKRGTERPARGQLRVSQPAAQSLGSHRETRMYLPWRWGAGRSEQSGSNCGQEPKSRIYTFQTLTHTAHLRCGSPDVSLLPRQAH